MQMGKLKEKVAGELEKISSGFQYIPGNICRLSPDDDEPVTIQQLKESIQKGAVICPRCGGEMELGKDGKWFCRQDGLVLTEEILKRFGIK